ncbi:MAG: polysaccharide deacetylase family protein [Actinomycetota bacterium]
MDRSTTRNLRSGLKRGVGSGIKVAAAAADRVRRPPAGVTVLIYHRVGRRAAVEMDLDASVFDAQMAELAASGRAIDLDRALALLDGTAPRPTVDPVVVTFDDGTADFAEVAVPILERHRIPALMYLATGFLDDGRAFPHDGTPMSWSAARDALTSGVVTFGSHTHTHALLDRIAPGAAADELDRSIDRIATETGAAPRHFAYPKAVPPSAEVDALVRARFASAALAGTRRNPYGRTDPLALARSPIQAGDGMAWFRRKVDGGLGLEDRLRGVANRVRYRGATV